MVGITRSRVIFCVAMDSAAIQPAPFFVLVLKNCWGMSAHPVLSGEIPVNIGCLAFLL